MLLYLAADGEYAAATQVLQAMERLRKVAAELRPLPPLKPSDLPLMVVLAHQEHEGFDCVTASQLAKMLGQSLPAISQKLSALEARGFVRRKTSKGDRRISYIRLTEKGKQQAEQNWEKMLAQLEEALKALGKKDVETLVALMGRLTEAIGQLPQEESEEGNTCSK